MVEQSSMNFNNISLVSTSLPPICSGNLRMALTSPGTKSLSVLTNNFSNKSGCLTASSRTPKVLNPSLSWSSKTFFLLKTKCTRIDCTISVLFSLCQRKELPALFHHLKQPHYFDRQWFDVTDSNRKKCWSSVLITVRTPMHEVCLYMVHHMILHLLGTLYRIYLLQHYNYNLYFIIYFPFSCRGFLLIWLLQIFITSLS